MSDNQSPLPFPPGLISPAFLQVPQVIFNGSTNTVSNTEIVSVLSFSDRPLIALIMNPITARTYAEELLDRVREYEQKTGLNVPTLKELEKKSG
jgi:hypothetical protein